MASSGLVLSGLFFISLVLEAESGSQMYFVKVVCQKSEVVAQFGSNTLLDCVVRPQGGITEPVQILSVTWKLNGKPVLQFFDGKEEHKTSGFQFASSPYSASNMNVSLLITHTSLDHVGEYECDVVTDTGDDNEKMHLDVRANYSKPQIHSDPEKINPEKSFTLTCTALGGFPKGDIRWVVDDHPWINNPEVIVEKKQNGLYDLTSRLSFEPNTSFRKFVCEVYNTKGDKEDKGEFDIPVTGQTAGSKSSSSHIVAPVVVIGSLVVGLLVAVLFFCRRRQQKARRPSAAPLMNHVPVMDPDETPQIVLIKAVE